MNSFRLFSVAALALASLVACSDDDSGPDTSDAGAGGSDAGTGGSTGGSGGAVDSGAGGATGGTGGATGGTGGSDASAGGSDASPGGSDAGSGGTDSGAPDAGADSGDDAGSPVTMLDLADVKANSSAYDWFDFRPGIKKLILAGDAASEHIAILWYTTVDGGVALHYHAKTESVYVIDGTQTDAKGVYPSGTVYFNPPTSGHQITNSTGFFVLAYASPPDFASTALIQEYTPVRIDTEAADLLTAYPFEQKATGVKTYAPPLVSTGGLSAEFIDTTSATDFDYTGNYLIVIKGSCAIDGATYAAKHMVVTKTVTPKPYKVAAPTGSCLAMGVSF